jgi:glycosyltransferase involved in cell wall biosynthesis
MVSAPRLPLSVVIVAKNEAQNLPRCLASVHGWVNEIVVVLNDTTDDSEAIAKGFGAFVHRLPWQGYRDTKNAALALASHFWALSLDADEEVSPTLKASIVDFFAEDEPVKFVGARFRRKVWFINRWITHGDWYPDLSLRLIHRDHGRWAGNAFVHEKIACQGKIATLRGDLYHYSFPTISSHVAKINPFADLFLKQQQVHGTRFSLFSAVFRPFWRFFRAYVLKFGFLDGFPGFYIAWGTAFSAFVRYSRFYEEEKCKAPRPEAAKPKLNQPSTKAKAGAL